MEYQCRRNNVQGGGVGIYVKKIFSYTVNNELSVFVDRILESLFIEVSINSKKICIGSLYRPGSQHPNLSSNEQLSQFCDLFSSIADSINSKNHSTYIFGDTNIDCLKYSTSSIVSDFVDLVFSHGLLQVVTKPTRCTLTSATLIDQIFTNSHDDNFETIVVIGKLSDHFPILHFLSSRKPTARPKTLSSRDTSDAAINRFNDSLAGTLCCKLMIPRLRSITSRNLFFPCMKFTCQLLPESLIKIITKLNHGLPRDC